MLVVALASVTLGLPTSTVDAMQAPAPLRPDHAQVLVIIADHASGTTEFGGALNTHPCVFNLAEPFAAKDTIWAMNDVAECTGLAETDQSTAIFNADTGSMIKSSNPVLTTRAALLTSHAAIHGTMFINNERVLKRGVAHIDVAGESQVLYAGLSYDFGEYAVGIRDQICKNVPADLEGLDKVIDILLKQFLSARGQANGSQTGYLCAREQLGQAEGPCAHRG